MNKFPPLPTLKAFLEEFNIPETNFIKTGLDWTVLKSIYENYCKIYDSLETTGQHLFNDLMKISGVHSVRYRIKKPDHLIEKIIRKRIDFVLHPEKFPDETINLENYQEKITDLVGLRAIHLFKRDWGGIHDIVIEKWDIHGKPVANYREGDSKEYIRSFTEKGCETKQHDAGYRSVHYIITTTPARIKIYAELQVRTIFEEAWSEIDHTIRYPYYKDNLVYSDFLGIMNRLAGSADEMSSFIEKLKLDSLEKDKIFQKTILEREETIKDLDNKLQIQTQTSSLLKFVDFVKVPWKLNHWGGKVCFREGEHLLFKGTETRVSSGTEGSHCDLSGIFTIGNLYKIECKAYARGVNPTGKISLWCHDDIEVGAPCGMTDETGYIPISPQGTTLTLYFAAAINDDVRIHLQYKPGENETGEIVVRDGISIYGAK